jgi:predicted O-linked N-acetylglucosamine transferase (SPINDLY family)
MEQHDHKNFEIFAYYCGINRPDSTQARIQKGVDHWTDINGLSDDDAAAKSWPTASTFWWTSTATPRTRAPRYSRKPAPIIVNWFGYPMMGTPYHHYLIADDYRPPGDEIYYSENIVRLPCYQPNDRKRVIAAKRPPRAEAGLPEGAFVFSSFNGMQKLTARVYQRWMTILGRVPGSVLWLLSGTADTNERVRNRRRVAGRATASFSRIKWPIRIIWRAIRWPIFSSTVSLMAPTPQPPMRCGWACRSSPFRGAASRRGSAPTWCGRLALARWMRHAGSLCGARCRIRQRPVET